MGNENAVLRERNDGLKRQLKMSEEFNQIIFRQQEEYEIKTKQLIEEVAVKVADRVAKACADEFRKGIVKDFSGKQPVQAENGKYTERQEDYASQTAKEQDRHVKKRKCLIYNFKATNGNNDSGNGLPNAVEELYEEFGFTVEKLRNLSRKNEAGDYDFVAFYIFHLSTENQLNDILQIVEKKSPNVPWLVVIKVKPRQNVSVGDELLPNTLLVTTADGEFVSLFNEELRLQKETLDLSTILRVVMNRLSAEGKHYGHSVNTLDGKVFL